MSYPVIDGGPSKVPEQTPVQMFWRNAEASPEKGGYLVRPDDEGDFDLIPWPAVRDMVRAWAAGLLAAGVQPGDRVAIFSDTCMEWKIADQAILACGGVVVPIYPTLAEDQVAHIVADADVGWGFVADDGLAECLPPGGHWWRFHGDAGVNISVLDAAGKALLAEHPDAIDERVRDDDMDRTATIIYTSGTTGVPKGVVLSNRHWAASTSTNVQGLRLDRLSQPSMLAFLPMAHVAGYASLLALTALRGTIAFSRPDRMAKDFPAVRPTLLVAVPRLYERIVSKVKQAVAEAAPSKQWIFARAERTAMAAGKALEDGGRPGPWLSARQAFYDRLVFAPLRRKLGFDRVEMGLTGAAAVRPDLLYFLQGMGLRIVEAYGMTETTGLVTSNDFDRFRAGTVGRPMAGTQVTLANDGEVLLRGAMIFDTYLGLPDDTADTFRQHSGATWLATGDIGELDDDGFLRIVDRKKELEVLDTGKKIAPVRVEELLKGESPLVEDSCLIGSGQKYAGLLIQPAYDAVLALARRAGVKVEEDQVVRHRNPAGEMQTYTVGEEMLQDARIRAPFQEAVERLNARLADFEQVRRFDLIPQAFTVDRGELTPTYKKKRRVILANHADRVKALFA